MRAAELVHARAETAEPAERLLLRLRRSLDFAVPAALLLAIASACVFGPLLSSLPEPVGGSVLESNRPLLSPGHFLGTDSNGNDTWSRLLHGGRASLGIAVAVNLLGLAIGGLLGAASAQAGGMVDSLTMRLLDVLIAFPSLVLVLAIAQSLGPSYAHTILALVFVSVPVFARVARAATLRLREQPFMLAAVLSGTRGLRLLVRHVAPNVLPQLATFALLGMGIVMLIEGGLSFLGLGVPRPMPSWGNMIAQGQETLSVRPVLVLLPSAFLFVTVLAFNLLGEALRARWSSR
jgi:peptide/nickel transport system permease protein